MSSTPCRRNHRAEEPKDKSLHQISCTVVMLLLVLRCLHADYSLRVLSAETWQLGLKPE